MYRQQYQPQPQQPQYQQSYNPQYQQQQQSYNPQYQQQQQQYQLLPDGPQHISVVTNVFNRNNRYTNFTNMITMSNYNNTLFIFNDNDKDHYTNKKGANNAEIRIYNFYAPNIPYPRSAGIPTGYSSGSNGGYTGLMDPDPTLKKGEVPYKSIVFAYVEILSLLYMFRNRFTQIIYSVNNKKTDLLSTSTFKVDDNVIEFITYLLQNIDYYYRLFYNTIERHEDGIISGAKLFTQILFKRTEQFINKNIEKDRRIIQKAQIERQQEEERNEKKRKEGEEREKRREERREEREKREAERIKNPIDKEEREKEEEKERQEEEKERQEEEKERQEEEKKRDKKRKEDEEHEEDKEDKAREQIEKTDDATKIKKRMKDFLKLMNKYKDTIKSVNKNETKLYKLFINLNTEIVDIPSIFYETSMTDKNEPNKYMYVNPYAPFTKETDLYNKKYNIKLKEKQKQQNSINVQLEYNVKEIVKHLFKEGTIIYLGKASKPYVIKSYTFEKAVIEDDDDDDDADEKDTSKKQTPVENIEDDILHKKTILMNTIKISYFNNDKSIHITISLNLFPGKTLPAANSPNFKAFDCLQKENDVYKKWSIFSGIEQWYKVKKDNPFENTKRVMTGFIDDAIYQKYAETGNKEKNTEPQNTSTNKNRNDADDTRRRRTNDDDDTRRRRTNGGSKRRRRRTKGGSKRRRHRTKRRN